MSPPLLTLKDIALTFGGTPLFDGAEFSVSPGDRVCIVGRNGSGKSTLLKIAAGLVEPDAGERFIHPRTTTCYLEQEPDFAGFETALDFAVAGRDEGDGDYRARQYLEALGLTGAEKCKNLSGGEKRRVALAAALATDPDILFLDEPTNHLDLPAIEWLETTLKPMRAALVLISHDRRFLQNLSQRCVWVDRGRTREYGEGFATFEAWRDEMLEREDLEAHKLDRKIVREEHWLRYGVTARRKRNEKRLADLGRLREKRRETGSMQARAKARVQLAGHEAEKSGRLVIETKGVNKAYGDKVIARDFACRILRGDRLGIIGPNGAGKTTLLSMLTGMLAPDEGTVRLGENLATVTLEQTRASLDPTLSVRDALTDGGSDRIPVGDGVKHVMGYMKDFLFTPEQAGTPVSELSGGERGRLMLARALAKPSNLLVLDEPTNDLDLETLDLLQEMLAGYTGTVILISHDRDFLDRTVTSVLNAEGDGVWLEYAGGYKDMERVRRAPKTSDKAQKKKSSGQKQVSTKDRKERLSFKENHLLETLPARMEELQSAIATFEAALADPDLFSRDRDRYNRTAANLAKAREQHEACEEQWLELEMKREALAGEA